MSDLIERQKAIEALLKEFERDTPKAIRAKLTLENLPSAQPEKRTEKHTETHACDLISRQAAIDAHYEYCNKHPDAGFPVWSLKILEDLPSAQPEVLACGEGELIAQPERKKGKWIDRGWSGDGRGNSWHEWECSECKHITKGAKWDFCPNCGADMQRGAV